MAGNFDGEEFGKSIVEAVNASIDRQLAPLLRRLDALEAIDVRTPMSELERRLERDIKRFDESMERALNKMATLEMIDAAVSKAVEADETIQVIEVLADKAVAHYVKDIPPARDGKDVDMEAVRAMIVEECKDIRAGLESTIGPEMQEALSVMVSEAVKAIPPARDGKDADPVDTDAIAEQVRSMIVLPELPDIVIPELPDIAGMMKELSDAVELRTKSAFDHWRTTEFRSELDEAIKAIPVPDIAAMVDEAVKAIDIPVPKDGTSVTVDDVKPLIDDAVSKAVAAIPPARDGKDGADVMDAFLDKIGHLVLTFSDGRVKDVGQVVGDDGVDCDFDGVWKLINEKLDSWPKPKDGLGFDDLSFEHDGERSFKFVMMRGTDRKEFPFTIPVVLDRGVYSEGKTYVQGDAVTWDGSSWIAQTDGAKEKPGTGKEWRLAIKRGRAGKDGVMTIPKAPGPVMLGNR